MATCDIWTVEVGSRGVVEVARLGQLMRILKVQGKKWAEFLVRLANSNEGVLQNLEYEEQGV